jgi:hypothetical protein
MATDDKQLRTYNWPLNGRLITKLDGTLLPDSHFQVLENMRYNDGGIEGVGGMTKINSTVLGKLKVQNGFHFKKTSPVEEDHVFVQVTDTSDSSSAIYKSDGTTAGIPSAETFSVVSEASLSTDNTVYFCEAPDQSMVFCDGYKNYVYSGNEYRAAQVINFDPDGTFFKDRTEIANNNLTDSDNIFTLTRVAGGDDSYTKFLYHLDNAVTDSSGGSHTLTNSNVTFSTTYKKFGTHGAVFNGTNALLYVADHADADLSGGIWTIDTWVYVTSLSAVRPIYYQNTTNDNDCFKVYIDTGGEVKILVKASSSATVEINSPSGVIQTNRWHHLECGESGDNWYIFVDGVLVVSGTDAQRAANYTGNVQIGKDSSAYFVGYMDEFRVSVGACRHTSNFTPQSVAYGDAATNIAHVYVGSTRPITGVKFYVSTANDTAATCGCSEWIGTGWSALSVTDGTASSGKTLAVTGTVTWSSTVSTSKVKVINENLAYYYYFTFTDIDAATALYMVTVQAPVQELVDLWDGVPRLLYSYNKYKTVYADETLNVYQLDYDSGDATTYSDISALTSSQYLYVGFAERMQGLKVYLGETKVNTNTAIAYVYYWNGSAWTNCGTLDDGTSVSGKSFNRTGVITWSDPGKSNEFTTTIGGSSQWYYYRISFSATLSANVYLDTIAGIPTQTDIKPYRFPVQWQNRLFLLNDQSSQSNAAVGSSYGTVCVFNGQDSGYLTFGGMRDLECGATLFTRYGGSIYENLIVCKKNETYLVDGTSFDDYIVYKISSTRGCVAPLTMKVCDTGYEVAPGLTKHTLVWLSTSGVIMFDANSMIEISNDIGDRFERKTDTKINFTYSHQSAAFYDSMMGGYHLLIATGSSKYPNEEWVYDLVRKKWWQCKRGTKYLWSGFEVDDSAGNKYVYGGTGDGYLERLEYGTTFDGVSIAYKFRLPDSLLSMSWDTRKELRQIRLVGICKTTTTQTVLCEHFADGSTTASTPAVYAIPQTSTGHRFYKWARSVSFRGNTHSLQFSITTTNETIGFSPLFVAGTFKVIDLDLEAK